jgi:glycosyltransferase involved in cell wall biosynthesis
MPAHNEQGYLAAAVERVVNGLRDRPEPFEVIVCENGSTDLTAKIASECCRLHPELKVVALPEADYGRALRAGFLASAGDQVVNFDVDLVDLGFLDAALTLSRTVDSPVIVVGSKRSPGSSDQRPAGRQIVTAIFSLVLRKGFGLRVSDTHGLKLLSRAPLVPVVAACRFGGDIFDTELILRAEHAGLEVMEIPVTVVDQRPPRTSIVRRIPRSLLGLARLRVTLWRERKLEHSRKRL